MLDHSSGKFLPNISFQKCLVRTIACPATSTERIGQDRRPDGFPNGPAPPQPRSPEPAKHGITVERMVPHHVQSLPAFQPLVHSLQLSRCECRVEIPRHEHVHLWVEGREEPPQHWERVGGVAEEGVRKLVDATKVKSVVFASNLAELRQPGVFWAEVVIQADAPVALVQ